MFLNNDLWCSVTYLKYLERGRRDQTINSLQFRKFDGELERNWTSEDRIITKKNRITREQEYTQQKFTENAILITEISLTFFHQMNQERLIIITEENIVIYVLKFVESSIVQMKPTPL